MSIVLFPANILLHASDLSHMMCMVLRFRPYILFVETALVSMSISLKWYSMEKSNFKKKCS